jgi:uncharacterized protein
MLPLLLVLAAAPPSGPEPRRLTVMGDAKLTAHANQALLRLALVITGRDAAGTKKLGDEKLRKLTAALLEAGVERKNLQLEVGAPVADQRGVEVIGYQQHLSVTLTVTALARLDEVLSAIASAGGASGGVTLLNTEHEAVESKVRVAAAQNARERAKGMIEALGGKLGLPVVVNDRTPVLEQLGVGALPVEGPVVTGWATKDLVYTSQVTVQFDIDAP